MRQITPEIMHEACDLVRRLRSGECDDDALSGIVLRLKTILPDPEFMGYAVDQVPELTPEEVVKKAFEYRPILLGPAPDWPGKKAPNQPPEPASGLAPGRGSP